MKVLIVMTDQSKAAELAKVCSGVGVSCQLADGGFYALTMLERDKPDAIVSSRDVLDMSGLDFYEIVRSDQSLDQTAFILLDETAHEDLPLPKDLAINANASAAYILKSLKDLDEVELPSPAVSLPKGLAMPKSSQISGTLEVLTLFDLMMSLNQNQHSGKLYLRIDDEEAAVVVKTGELVHAEMAGLVGEKALMQIFLKSEDNNDTEFYFERIEDSEAVEAYNSISGTTKEMLFKVAIELDHLREGVN